MKHFKKILCPFDFSEHAEEALMYALKLSDEQTLISLVNIVQIPYSIDPYGFAYYDSKADELKKASEEALLKRVDELKAKYPNITVDYLFEVDIDPAALILQIQKEKNYELIVMGSHGRKGLQRLLMGSVAESIMRDATCPVLVIKHK
jgi:universal stress protein A